MNTERPLFQFVPTILKTLKALFDLIESDRRYKCVFEKHNLFDPAPLRSDYALSRVRQLFCDYAVQIQEAHH